MKKEMVALILSCVLGLCPMFLNNAWSYIRAPQNILYLTNDANIVCKGQVLEVTQIAAQVQPVDNGTMTTRTMIARFQVDRLFKGKVTGNVIEIEFLTHDIDSRYPTLQQGEYCLVFLRTSGDKYTFSDLQGKMPISNEPVMLDEKENADTFSLLELEFVNSLKDKNKNVALTAMEQLGNLPKIRSTRPLKDMLLTLDDREIEGRIYTSLIKLRDYSEFPRAVEFIESQESDPQIRRAGSYVAYAISKIRDIDMLPQLHALIHAKSDILRENVVRAIRNIKNPISVKYLIECLDDANKDIRYQCVMGLVEIQRKGPGWGAARDIYDKDEQAYLTQWKNWWENEGKQKYSRK